MDAFRDFAGKSISKFENDISNIIFLDNKILLEFLFTRLHTEN